MTETKPKVHTVAIPPTAYQQLKELAAAYAKEDGIPVTLGRALAYAIAAELDRLGGGK